MRRRDTYKLINALIRRRHNDAIRIRRLKRIRHCDEQLNNLEKKVEKDVKQINQIKSSDSKFNQLRQKVNNFFLRLKEAMKTPIMQKYKVAFILSALFSAVSGLAYYLVERRRRLAHEHNMNVIRGMGEQARGATRELAAMYENASMIAENAKGTIERMETELAALENRERNPNGPFGGPGPVNDF